MTIETDEALYYDEAMTGDGARALLPVDESPWRPVYEELARWLAGSEPLVDLGCGTGRFAVTAALNSHTGGYTGIDISSRALAETERYIAEVIAEYPVDELRVQDLRDWQPPDIRPAATTYICSEVLEHLEDDLDLVARIPAGHRFLFTVPNYGSQAHVRRFQTPASIWERYGGLLEFRRWTLIPIGNVGKAIHAIDSTRRSDSWQ